MYGEMVDTMCRSAVANAPARPRGSLLLALNVAANTSLVPTQYGGDVALRSMPYEVARNGAALAAARRSGAAAVDLFSPLLGVQEWAHRDAVHLNAPAGLHAARALARALLHALEAPGGG